MQSGRSPKPTRRNIAKSHWIGGDADAPNQLARIRARERRCKADARTLQRSPSRKLHHREATAPTLNQRRAREVSPTPCRQSRDSCLASTHQNRRIGTAKAKGI